MSDAACWSFTDLLVISVLSSFLALVFSSRPRPSRLVVFAAIPFGAVAALLSLGIALTPSGE